MEGEPEPIPVDKYQSLRSAVEAALVRKAAPAEGEAPEQPYARFDLGGLVLTQAPVDSDGDSVSDLREKVLGTDPDDPDTDGDGLSDAEELRRSIDPTKADTDGDGVFDKSVAFAENLDSPVAVACWDGGVFVGIAWDLGARP